MATKAKRPAKYHLILILKEEYKKEGRPDKFELQGNSLEKLLLFANRHTGSPRQRIPWQYLGLWRNTRYDPFESGENLFWTRLP